MMMFSSLRQVLCAALPLAAVACAPAWTQAQAQQSLMPRMVVELFTSQGCSSSPKADAVLRDLVAQPDVIALSYPVDYWDYLGWKDTLATPANTARQKAYAALRGDHKVYTPQAVVDGRSHAVGSKGEAIRALGTKGREHGALNVPLTAMLQGTTLSISAADSPGHGPLEASVVVLALSKTETVAVERGENAGRTISYHNIVRSIHPAGTWNGVAQRWQFDLSSIRDARVNGYVVLLQVMKDDKPGMILGGAKVGI
ncbi:MAG: DUF1223 domain-containing protein [Beijerinckiaceae bacterium]